MIRITDRLPPLDLADMSQAYDVTAAMLDAEAWEVFMIELSKKQPPTADSPHSPA